MAFIIVCALAILLVGGAAVGAGSAAGALLAIIAFGALAVLADI